MYYQTELVLGQETNAYYFQQFDNRNGLSNSAVNRVFQDKDQLLWIGTWDGLNMYDGTEFRIFNYNTENHGNGIGNNVIQDIKEDENANIWISTVGGITRFEKDTGKFYQYFYNLNIKRSITEKEYKLVVSGDGTVFCYSKTYGLSRFDMQTNQFKQMKSADGFNAVVKIESGKGNVIWALQNDGQLSLFKAGSSGTD